MAKLVEEKGRKCIGSAATLKSHKMAGSLLAGWGFLTKVRGFRFLPAPRSTRGTALLQLCWSGEKGAQDHESSGTLWRQPRKERESRKKIVLYCRWRNWDRPLLVLALKCRPHLHGFYGYWEDTEDMTEIKRKCSFTQLIPQLWNCHRTERSKL